MDSYDRDELIDRLEEIIRDIYDMEEDFGDELEDCSQEFKDARLSLSMIRDAVEDIKCPDDKDEEVYNEEEM